jgi:hypothetical protein
MKELLVKLEDAIRSKRPQLCDALRRGLPEASIRSILRRRELSDNNGVVIDLYSWKNGADASKARVSFFPHSMYEFLSLETAVVQSAVIQESVSALVASGTPIQMPKDTKNYLPVFWDGVTGYLAIDLRRDMNSRVIEIEFEAEKPYREICKSFGTFLTEAARAIQADESPVFLLR